jgi:hypothetical protein
MALKDWHKVALRSWEKGTRWISWNHFKDKKFPFVVDTMKNGELEILGRFKTKKEADVCINNYMKSH